jgi:acyl-CoA dehydrogenase
MLISLLLALVAALALLFVGRGFLAWMAAAGVLLLGWRVTGVTHPLWFEATVVVLTLLVLVFGLPPLRRALVSRVLMARMAKIMPKLGDTERIALEAGTVWWDADLFSGRPEWQKLLDTKVAAAAPGGTGVPERARWRSSAPGSTTGRSTRSATCRPRSGPSSARTASSA